MYEYYEWDKVIKCLISRFEEAKSMLVTSNSFRVYFTNVCRSDQ